MGADAVRSAEGETEMSPWPDIEVPPGSKSDGMHALGMSRNLGGPVVSIEECRYGSRLTKTQALVGRGPTARERRGSTTMVAPSEGNEVTREGRQGVGVLNSTDDVGELAPGDPAEERRAPGTWNRRRERWETHRGRKPSLQNNDG